MRRGRRSKARGHATVFNGIQFRSRLEARVAALFDILDWDFTYEPDLNLTYYIPDFYIVTCELVAEVKPLTKLSNDHKEVAAAQTKINDSGYEGRSMLIGAVPRLDAEGRVVFGLMTEGPDATEMVAFHLTREEGTWMPCTCASGCIDSVYERTNQLWAKYQWTEAGNAVQFKKPRTRQPK